MLKKEFDNAAILQMINEFEGVPGALLPVLHCIQETLGFIPRESVGCVAEFLNLSHAEVHGVISFYQHFRQHACGKHILEVCQAEACQSRGGRELDAHVREHLKCDFNETTADGQFTLEPVYCLGLCATGPSIAIDGKPYSRVNVERFNQLVEMM